MDVRPVCCEPCQALRFCRPERNCCLECHFSYEEEIAFPFVPVKLQQQLRFEHQMLQANGFPPRAVHAHALREEAIFRRYCPPEVCDLIERDHQDHGHGQLVSREQFQRQRNGDLQPSSRATSAR